MPQKLNNYLLALCVAILLLLYFYTANVTLLHHLPSDFQFLYFSGLSYWYFHDPYISVITNTISSINHIVPSANLSAPLLVAIIAYLSQWLSCTHLFFWWIIASTLACFSGVYLSQKYIISLHPKQHFLSHLFILLLLGCSFFTYTFGQCGLLFLFGITVFTLLYMRHFTLAAAMVLAIMTAFKLFFLYFLLFFFAKRQWRTALYYLTLSLLFINIPILFNWKASVQHYLAALNHITWYLNNWNGSFLGFFSRFFGLQNTSHHALLPLPYLTKCLYYLFAVIYASLTYFFCRKSTDTVLCIGLTMTSMLLLSPLGWYYYFSMYYPFFCYAFLKSKRYKHPHGLQFLLLLVLLCVAACFPFYTNKLPPLGFYLSWGQLPFAALLLFFHAQFALKTTPSQRDFDGTNPCTGISAKTLRIILLIFLCISAASITCSMLGYRKVLKNPYIPFSVNIFDVQYQHYIQDMQSIITKVRSKQAQKKHHD